ncbi:MAG TPA: START-like domain-containing protein [Bacteroidia bacterium]|nr:START-like domain-containing protein [Bacteroidia bacterium]
MTIVKPDTKTNKKQKYTLEFEIKSSPKILYNYLSTASGLEEWFADKVNIREGDFIFHWEGSEQRARIINKKENSVVRYKWQTDDKKDDTYFQFEIVQDEITSDVALIVTDFASDDEKEENVLLWNSQIHNLMHHIGS